MKILSKILALSFLLCVVNTGLANGTELDKQPGSGELEQEGEKKQNPNGLDSSQELEGGSVNYIEEEESTIDSTEDDSVSKYNFIFYFLYKMKYDENQEMEEMF